MSGWRASGRRFACALLAVALHDAGPFAVAHATAAAVTGGSGPAAAAAAPIGVAFSVVGDAIPAPLTDVPGDPARGRAIVTSRQTGLCLLCHAGPFAEAPFQGTLAPSLAGAGSRYGAGQLRLRIADGKRLNPASVMPSYAQADGLQRVGTAWRGKAVLTAQQIEDVVAFLATLRE